MGTIWWIRRDLRLNNNPALQYALKRGGAVVPVFILDEDLLARSAEKKLTFLYAGLVELDTKLRKRGSRLVIRRGKAWEVLPQLILESGCDQVAAEEDYSPYARRRDERVAKVVPLKLVHGLTVHPPQAVVKINGNPYSVFTAFSKAWWALPAPSRSSAYLPDQLSPVLEVFSETLPAVGESKYFPAGECEANRRLEQFVAEPIFHYAYDRNRMDLPGTSCLSPYFHLGMLSARQALLISYTAHEKCRTDGDHEGVNSWINELVWREFYQVVLYHFPFVLDEAFYPSRRQISWRESAADLKAWQDGLTGYPLVDAAMRQLLEMGWMHNRARMIVASFLVKDLLINWQEGERWFMRHLVDGDLASNNGGWQWSAGVGTDAAPYFRIFNPVSQSLKHDPDGEYIRHWVPELRLVPVGFIHSPWEMTAEEQSLYACRIGRDYPARLVDHAAARERVLVAFRH